MDLNESQASSNAGSLPPTYPRVSFIETLKMRPITWASGQSGFEVVIEERHLRMNGIAHGGVIATMLDSVMGWAAAAKAPPEHGLVTVQLSVNFIRPAWEGETLRGRGEVIHAGKQTSVVRGDIYAADDVLVASGMGTFFYLPPATLARGDAKFAKRPD